LVGVGNFALRTLLPLLPSVGRPVRVETVVSRQGAAAWLGAQAAGAARATTDLNLALSDPAVDAVLITTRHDAHARQAVAALRAGKHVWVEKPLCLTLEELSSIEAAVASARPQSSVSRPPILMVGFNRRFAPMSVALRRALADRPAARRFVVTVNAGRLDPDHWTLDPRSGGGRIVGEGCHFVDLLRFLTGAAITRVRCVRRDTDGQDGGAFELEFADGSAALLDYRTDLPAHHPKEVIQVSGSDGLSAEIWNWARLRTTGLGGLRVGAPWSRTPRKGHREALEAFLAGVAGQKAPVPIDEISEVSRWSITMQGMGCGDTAGRN
jgi:predicted dehydrogenase